jgi:hypothetical protein
VRGAQAQEAFGQALQQATDPATGSVDYAKAQQIAAADPIAVLAMQQGLLDTSRLTGEQVNNVAGPSAIGRRLSRHATGRVRAL